MLLNFSVRMGTGVSNMVNPLTASRFLKWFDESSEPIILKPFSPNYGRKKF
jgi:hypothetical protein